MGVLGKDEKQVEGKEEEKKELSFSCGMFESVVFSPRDQHLVSCGDLHPPGVLTALSDSITEEQQMDSTYDLWFLRNQMCYSALPATSPGQHGIHRQI